MISTFAKIALIALLFCVEQYRCQQQCNAAAGLTSCYLPVLLYDQSAAWQIHKNYPSSYWVINNWSDQPTLGDAGTANNGQGFPNSDFEMPLYMLGNLAAPDVKEVIINGESGLVGTLCSTANNFQNCGTINTQDRTPQYAYPGRSPLGQVTSPAAFNNFFHATPQTFPVNYNITLITQASNPSVYTFNQEMFFPLDGKGWNDHGFLADGKTSHNFGYCMVLNGRFTYKGGEYFYFSGDDDVYCYINDLLVIDLGGVHTALNTTIYTDDLPLSKGQSYRFDFFYCERHTVASEIAFDTNIDFFCSYSDWCGVCEGNGQSCCTPQSCDDGNACTADSCGVTLSPDQGGCVHVNTTCPATDACHTIACDPSSGNCVPTAIVCNDHNACTTDSCSPTLGCQFLPITCDDKNACTNNTCDPIQGCLYPKITCADSSLCTQDGCDPSSGCTFTTLPCNPTNSCVTAQCTASAGCLQTPKPPCNDNNVCTTDSCDPVNGCIYSPNPIPPGNQCYSWTCDPINGLTLNTKSCNDGDACTTDICVNSTGCQHTEMTCTGNSCFSSKCVNGACVDTALGCPSSTACLNVTCNNATGCLSQPTVCDDGNACTNDTCSDSVVGGCVHTSIATCLNCGGITCTTSDPCKPVVCQNSKCVETNFTGCDDHNLCTQDTCVASGNKATCQYTTLPCLTANACFPFSCTATGGCTNSTVVCNDNNNCTTDVCVNNGGINATCSFTPVDCTTTDFCHPTKCSAATGTCVPDTPPNCDDGNACTNDACSNGNCTHTPVCPSAGTPCSPISCQAGVCVTKNVTCNSGNLCVNDVCENQPNGTAACITTPVNCPGSICSPMTCNPSTGKCVPPPAINCDDSNPCTNDATACNSTAGFYCTHTDAAFNCNDSNVCTNDFCNSSDASASTTAAACYHTNITCAAATICEVALGCDARNGCLYGPKICPTPSDWCQLTTCDSVAGCVITPRPCYVTDNYCYQAVCNSDKQTCTQVERPNWSTIRNANGVTCLLAYNNAAKAGLAAGTVAGIVIAAVVAAAIIAVAGKKGVDVFMASRAAPIGGAVNNPLYDQPNSAGTNALFNT